MAVNTMTMIPFKNSKKSCAGLQTTLVSFWQGLTQEEKEASTNPEYSRSFNDEHAWDPAGLVQDAWNKSIYPNILKPLFRRNSKGMFKHLKKQPRYIITCWMVGTEIKSAHPAVVFICADEPFAKQAVKLIKKSEAHGRWGFQVYEFRAEITSNSGCSDTEEREDDSVCGTLFVLGDGINLYQHSATVGGAVSVNSTYFGLTVSHPFLDAHYDYTDQSTDTTDTTDTTDRNNEDSDESSYTSESDITIGDNIIQLRVTKAFVNEGTTSNGSKLLGYIPETMPGLETCETQPIFWSQVHDWALIYLPEQPAKNSINVGETEIMISKFSTWSEGPVWAAVSSQEPISTTASRTLCGLFTPYSGLRDVYALNMKSVPGACGAWVVNAEERSVVGSIVAGCTEKDITYAVPAYDILESIKRRFPSVHLPPLDQSNSPARAETAETMQSIERELPNVTTESSAELDLKDASSSKPGDCDGGPSNSKDCGVNKPYFVDDKSWIKWSSDSGNELINTASERLPQYIFEDYGAQQDPKRDSSTEGINKLPRDDLLPNAIADASSLSLSKGYQMAKDAIYSHEKMFSLLSEKMRHLEERCKSLVKDRNQSEEQLYSLWEDMFKKETDYAMLASDHYNLKYDHDKLKHEHEYLKHKHENLKDEHEYLKDEHEYLKHKHEYLKDEHEDLKHKQVYLKLRHQQLKVELDTVQEVMKSEVAQSEEAKEREPMEQTSEE